MLDERRHAGARLAYRTSLAVDGQIVIPAVELSSRGNFTGMAADWTARLPCVKVKMVRQAS